MSDDYVFVQAQGLGLDELRVIADIRQRLVDEFPSMTEAERAQTLADVVSRLRMGATQYGPLNLATDTRDWAQEEREEWLDALVYRSCGRLK